MPFKTYRIGGNFVTTDGLAPEHYDEVVDITDAQALEIDAGADIDIANGMLEIFTTVTPEEVI